MLNYRVQGLKSVYYGLLMAVITILFWGYLFLMERYINPRDGYDNGQYLIYNLAALVALSLAALNSRKIHECLLKSDLSSNHAVATKNVAYVAITILSISVLLKDTGVSRLFLFSLFPLLYFVFFFSHQCIPRLLVRYFFSKRHQHSALLVGTRQKLERMTSWCEQTSALGVNVRSFLLEPEENASESDLPSKFQELERTIARDRISQIVLLELPSSPEGYDEIVSVCNRLGTRLLVVNNLPDLFKQPVSFFSLYGTEFIQIREEPLENPLNRVLKRLLDLAISIPIVFFVLPFLALGVIILHWLQSPGPLFYFQTRAGMSRHPFRIVKFRTMHVRPKTAAKQATMNDERIFKAGRLLRRTSLDELPQFINVLRGDMSIVGPRPHMIIHDRRFAQVMDCYHVRSFVKPGITGLAQVKGFRGEATDDVAIRERVRYDIKYLESWSVWRDIAILFSTGKQVIIPPKTAY